MGRRWCSLKSSAASPGCAMSSPMEAMLATKLRDALRRIGKWTIEIIKRLTRQGIQCPSPALGRRTNPGWLNRNRRLAK
jgi:hypothetical protein